MTVNILYIRIYALYYPHSIVTWIGLLPFSKVSPNPSIVRWWRLWVSRRRMKMPISCASKWRPPQDGIEWLKIWGTSMDFMSEDGKLHVFCFFVSGLTIMICGKMVVFTINHRDLLLVQRFKTVEIWRGTIRNAWYFHPAPGPNMVDLDILDPRYGPSKGEDVSLELATYQCESAIGCPLMCARWIPIASHSHHVPQQKHGNLGGRSIFRP